MVSLVAVAHLVKLRFELSLGGSEPSRFQIAAQNSAQYCSSRIHLLTYRDPCSCLGYLVAASARGGWAVYVPRTSSIRTPASLKGGVCVSGLGLQNQFNV